MISAEDALQRLKDGNSRFLAGIVDPDTLRYEIRREQLRERQAPFAIIVGCSDSRVPVEIVFDQGLGDLFVVRVAGNIVSRTQLGSIEFAAGVLDARLVVVLGHTGCGAVDATLKTVQSGKVPESENLRLIVEQIRPSAERAMAEGRSGSQSELVDVVGRENVRSVVDVIRHSPGIIRQLVEEEGLMVVGAEYSLATGAVEFF
ncbi:MAG: carbonic anhydrase [Gammaproteobacteria bacterium]|jgi:carbonic anhydrase|nr:carbonic anhydrase [Gammaproteobacteria bacterium]